MNNLIALSKKDHDAVIEKIAELLIKEHHIDLDEITVIPTATVSQLIGLSPKTVQRRFPITELSKQKQGVILKTLREFLARNTRPPAA